MKLFVENIRATEEIRQKAQKLLEVWLDTADSAQEQLIAALGSIAMEMVEPHRREASSLSALNKARPTREALKGNHMDLLRDIGRTREYIISMQECMKEHVAKYNQILSMETERLNKLLKE